MVFGAHSMAHTGGSCAACVLPLCSTSSVGRAAWRVCAPPHHTAEPAHTSSCPQLLAVLVFASASLFDPTWQINCSRLMLGLLLVFWCPLVFSSTLWLSSAVSRHPGRTTTRMRKNTPPGTAVQGLFTPQGSSPKIQQCLKEEEVCKTAYVPLRAGCQADDIVSRVRQADSPYNDGIPLELTDPRPGSRAGVWAGGSLRHE